MRTFERSMELFEIAQRVTPGGAQTGSKAPGRVGPLGAFPLYLGSGNGAYVRCVDNHEYVDWFNGNCAVTLGHGDPYVTMAVQRELKGGTLLSLPTEQEVLVARQLVDVIPCAEQVRFVKTGSEACAAAVRIARIATNRELVAVCAGQYHGWHDWTVARNDYTPGIPEALRDLVKVFRYNDLDQLRWILETWPIAAVMLEPTLVTAPAKGFLAGVVDLAHQHGALVIFDEMITGARWSLGGAQEYFGVTPDLATFGKAFGNGFPLAFVAGRADLMQHAWPISGTFGGETASLAACDAVLHRYRIDNVVLRIWETGQRLMDGVNGLLARHRIPARMVGYPCRPVLEWASENTPIGYYFPLGFERDLYIAIFQQELAQHGVLAHPSGWNPSAAHDSLAVERTLGAVDEALATVAAALASKNPRGFLRGELLKPAFVRLEAIA